MANILDREAYLKFNRAGNHCLLCGIPLNVNGAHPSLIELSAGDEAVRKDFCPTCWGAMGRAQYFSYWVTKRIDAPSVAQRRLAKSERNEALWRLFSALHMAGNSELDAQLFLLAHLLLRYRVMVFLGVSADGRLRFQNPKFEEEFLIREIPANSADFAAMNKELEARAVAMMAESV